MHIHIDVKCMQTNFGGGGFSGYRVYASFCLSLITSNIPCSLDYKGNLAMSTKIGMNAFLYQPLLA